MFSAMLTDAFKDGDVGIPIRYRTDGKLLNLRRLQAKTKVKTEVIRDFLFADDCALNTGTETDMQLCVNKFSDACTNFGLTISTKKTEVMHQPAPGKPYIEPNIIVYGNRLKAVDRFTYLGSTLSKDVIIDEEINTRIAKASAAFGRLRANVWNRRGISLHTKLKVYKAMVLPTLLYASETWTVYRRHAMKLNHFHTTSLRKLLGIKWQDRIPDTDVLARAGLPTIHTILMQTQLRWASHVNRMEDHRLPKILFYGELQNGKRSQGGQKKRFKDTLKQSLKAFDIPPDTWELIAKDRVKWRSSVHQGAISCETKRTISAVKRRQARKDRANDPIINVAFISCPHCNKTFRARIGLFSHLRTHKSDHDYGWRSGPHRTAMDELHLHTHISVFFGWHVGKKIPPSLMRFFNPIILQETIFFLNGPMEACWLVLQYLTLKLPENLWNMLGRRSQRLGNEIARISGAWEFKG